MFDTFWEHVWRIFDTCWEHFRRIFDTRWEHLCRIFDTFWEHVWHIFDTLSAHVGNILGYMLVTFLLHFLHIFGTCSDIFGIYFSVFFLTSSSRDIRCFHTSNIIHLSRGKFCLWSVMACSRRIQHYMAYLQPILSPICNLLCSPPTCFITRNVLATCKDMSRVKSNTLNMKQTSTFSHRKK